VSNQPPLTTEALLDTAEERMGLTRQQLLILVAKSATVRHLATHPHYKELFVLKGGTLLSNVYLSPRQSIADADYTYLEPEQLTIPQLDAAFAIKGEYGFHLDADWSFDREMFDGKHQFSIEGITLSRSRRSPELKVTVSVRAGEWLDRDKDNPPLIYHDSLLPRAAHRSVSRGAPRIFEHGAPAGARSAPDPASRAADQAGSGADSGSSTSSPLSPVQRCRAGVWKSSMTRPASTPAAGSAPGLPLAARRSADARSI
jgi:hypothetical protein